ncbi:MAG: zinc ribbon domain-containing protein [Actinobacteria bacterium]|nr:zinc ribbon domain-containing protein [Actinomycetota bacterium]
MVSRTTLKKLYILVALLLVLSMVTGFSLTAVAQEEEETPTIEEEYTVELNSVGDGHIVDTITYDEEDYEVVKEIAEESKGFLTRRYSAVDFTGELVDFNTEFDDENGSVIITYDMPGYAYNSEGSWMVYGFPEKPEEEGDLTFITTETSTTNSEFTLFTDQVIETTSTIKLPEDAKNAGYDSHEQAITYETTPPGSSLGFWSENKTLLLIVFGIAFFLFLGLLIFVITRKAVGAGPPRIAASPGGVAGTDYPIDAFAPSATTEGSTPPPAPVTPGVEITEVVEEAVVEETTLFCTSCGQKVPSGKQFCTHCGKPVDK